MLTSASRFRACRPSAGIYLAIFCVATDSGRYSWCATGWHINEIVVRLLVQTREWFLFQNGQTGRGADIHLVPKFRVKRALPPFPNIPSCRAQLQLYVLLARGDWCFGSRHKTTTRNVIPWLRLPQNFSAGKKSKTWFGCLGNLTKWTTWKQKLKIFLILFLTTFYESISLSCCRLPGN